MKKLIKSQVLLFALCLVLYGCSGNAEQTDNDIPPKESISYTIQQVVYSEPHSHFGMKTFMETTTVANTTFYFEKSIAESDRLACIEQTEMLLERLNSEKALNIHIYDYSNYKSEYVSDEFVYTYARDWNSPEYLTILLRGIYGELCNYGMTYGYANYILGQSDTSALKFEKDFEFYDLNDLCFHPNFVSEDEKTVSESVANAFVSEYIKENGEAAFIEILKASGDVEEIVKANDALEDFYAKNGIDTELSTILYGFGGMGYNYTAKCEYAKFYVENDWEDNATDLYPEYPLYDGFFNNNYSKTKEYLTVSISQMKQYQDYFALDSYDNSLEIIVSDFLSLSEYQNAYHRIFLSSTVSLMHEYIHSLTSNSLNEKWAIEGFATYYEYLYNEYALPFWYYDANSHKAHPYVQQYRDNIGRDIDSESDLTELDNLNTYYFEKYDPNDTYASGASFIQYLVKQFGERPVLDYVLINHDLSTLTDLKFAELVEGWKEYLETNYSDYAKK